jgi:hypothetical protein
MDAVVDASNNDIVIDGPLTLDDMIDTLRDDLKFIQRRFSYFKLKQVKNFSSAFGIGILAFFVLMYIRYIIMFLAMIASAAGINFAIVSYMVSYNRENDDIIDFTFEHDPEIQRLKFQNANYEELLQAFLSNNNDVERDLKYLKEPSEHMTIDMSAFPCKKTIVYYDSDQELFKYYTQVGEMTQTMLNAVCRQYCLEKNVTYLYKDENDWEFMVSTYGKEEDREKLEKYLPVAVDHIDDKESSFVDVSDETIDDKGESKSLFVSKSEDSKTIDVKRSTFVHKKTNKFLKLGSIEDYEAELRAKQRNEQTKNVDYKSFMQGLLGKSKTE